MKNIILLAFLCVFFVSRVDAIEIHTHAVVTQKAIERTILLNNVFQRELGLDEYKDNFGLKYYDYDNDLDVEGNHFVTLVERSNDDFDDDIIKDDFKEGLSSIKAWFMRGAIREDDCWIPFGICNNPLDDPVNAIRPFSHFFDPYNNIGLVVLGFEHETAPSWALGSVEPFKAPIKPLPDYWNNLNHYTVFDAQRAMVRALSGQYIDDSGEIISLDESERRAYWATTFRALGNVVHLVQDMGQPQHTRGDAHSKRNTLEQQVYEKLTNVRALIADPEEKFKCFDESDPAESITPLNFSSYPVPQFNKYGDYFSTQPGGKTQDGKGLADYSNRNFFTAGTNKEASEFPSPDNKELIKSDVSFNSACVNKNSAKKYILYNGEVDDEYDSTQNAVLPLTARSIWDIKDASLPKYALTLKNYVAMADNLIPRSVSYSAGLINFFFRGRLDVTKSENTTDTSGNTLVAITIKNTSGPDFQMSNGKIEIFYDAIVDGEEIRKPVQLAEGETGNITELPNGDETTLKIILPGDIDTNKENPFVIVYNGIIGKEPGVAGKVFSLSEETAILLFYEKDGSTDLLVKRSVDEGKSWENVDATNFASFRLYPNSRGYQLLPSGKGRGLLVGTNSSGIFTLRTTDNGNSWAPHLEQAYGQYTEVLNVIRAIHAGDGRLITYNNIYSGSYKVGTRTYYTYDVELSESFDDGESWTPLSLPFDVNGSASQLFYLGNQHLYLLTSGYDIYCGCVKSSWYESFDSGENFTKAEFTYADLEWKYDWYRDAYAFDDGKIITMKNMGTLDLLTYNFAVSHDGGKTLNITDKASKNEMWPQAEPIHIRPIGQGKFVSYVFDPWTAYEKGYDTYYEGSLVSKDRGQNWTEMSQGTLSTWNGPWYLMMGVLTKDGNNLKYIH
ncbi:MAG: hypothetical protein OQK75_02080 [Gammaproteobacteria bacterium]|nr:hypothetical protein [Gammaproteobacteria bacterium]MCW8986436.1 hypothetical protein [Gammaproteobacteria bacterium]MCW9030592.1 hypothetical protein [Gammaproteobacteria bacterium]